MNFEITEISDFSGEMAHIYSVIWSLTINYWDDEDD